MSYISTTELVAPSVLIDRAVRVSRDRGWCDQFRTAMRVIFGPSVELYDSDGFDCHGYDREGFTREGVDHNGMTRTGVDHMGRDRNGVVVDDVQFVRYQLSYYGYRLSPELREKYESTPAPVNPDTSDISDEEYEEAEQDDED